jgi:hypothetical protein
MRAHTWPRYWKGFEKGRMPFSKPFKHSRSVPLGRVIAIKIFASSQRISLQFHHKDITAAIYTYRASAGTRL